MLSLTYQSPVWGHMTIISTNQPIGAKLWLVFYKTCWYSVKWNVRCLANMSKFRVYYNYLALIIDLSFKVIKVIWAIQWQQNYLVSSAVDSAVETFHDEQVFTKFLCCVVCVNFTTIVSKIFTDTDLTVAGAHNLHQFDHCTMGD